MKQLSKLCTHIALGSRDARHLAALQSACRFLGMEKTVIQPFPVDSGQHAQPEGWDAIFRGAWKRAKGSLEKIPQSAGWDMDKTFGVGIESGIHRFKSPMSITIDLALIVITNPMGAVYVAASPGVRFPESAVKAAAEAGFETTSVGNVIVQRSGHVGIEDMDPHTVLTGGRLSQHGLLTEGIMTAFRMIPL
jgi:non-canonical (house-cleaning) NTP pyrophosphatase